jgi:hypothetical protein
MASKRSQFCKGLSNTYNKNTFDGGKREDKDLLATLKKHS